MTVTTIIIKIIMKTSLLINIQKKKMQVLKQESATLLILASQYSQVSQLSSIENSIVENAACRFLYTL